MVCIFLACVQPVLTQPTNKNLTDLSFTLEWSPVTVGLLQNYTLSYTSVPLVKRQADGVFSIPAGSTHYTVENLIPYSSYCFSLQATYAQGDVVFSQEQSDEICNINTPPLGEFVIKFSPSLPADSLIIYVVACIIIPFINPSISLASSAPVNLNVEEVSFTSVKVSWSAPMERHGIITQYKVCISVLVLCCRN